MLKAPQRWAIPIELLVETVVKHFPGWQEVFAKYASERSDCGSCQNGGDLGEFGPGEMQGSFEEGTRATPVGSMSGIVSGDSGHHIIWRYK